LFLSKNSLILQYGLFVFLTTSFYIFGMAFYIYAFVIVFIVERTNNSLENSKAFLSSTVGSVFLH
jgi:hypothetical protein